MTPELDRIGYDMYPEAMPGKRVDEHPGLAVLIERQRQAKVQKRTNAYARIYHHFGGRCAYCSSDVNNDPSSKRYGTVDHIIPKSRGGTEAGNNKALACLDCNREKADMTAAEFAIYRKARAHGVSQHGARWLACPHAEVDAILMVSMREDA